MSDLRDINRFAARYNACDKGLEWARANCKDMQEVWDTAEAAWLIWVATRLGVLTDNELRLFACYCAQQHWHLVESEVLIAGVDTIHGYYIGESSLADYIAAKETSQAVIMHITLKHRPEYADWPSQIAAVNSAIQACWWIVCESTAWYAAYQASQHSSWAAFWEAPEPPMINIDGSALVYPVEEEATIAARAGQSDYLRSNCKPDFGRVNSPIF